LGKDDILWPVFLVKKEKSWFETNMPKILDQGTGSMLQFIRKVEVER
jgi:hypothetical protein